MQARYKNSGTITAAVVLLIIVALVVVSIARYFWVDSATEHFNRLISIYIMEKEDLAPEDRDRLKAQMLEDGLFIKMYKWKKESFVKDKKLYNDMIITRDQWEMKKEEERGSVIDTLINL